jgi:hypothetical protein
MYVFFKHVCFLFNIENKRLNIDKKTYAADENKLDAHILTTKVLASHVWPSQSETSSIPLLPCRCHRRGHLHHSSRSSPVLFHSWWMMNVGRYHCSVCVQDSVAPLHNLRVLWPHKFPPIFFQTCHVHASFFATMLNPKLYLTIPYTLTVDIYTRPIILDSSPYT